MDFEPHGRRYTPVMSGSSEPTKACPNGHFVVSDARFCSTCGYDLARNQGQPDAPHGDGGEISGDPRKWGRRPVAAAVLLGLVVLTAGAGIAWRAATADREPEAAGALAIDDQAGVVTAEQQVAMGCAADYAWAVDSIVDYGSARPVMDEWGSRDGRLQTAMRLSSVYKIERAENGREAAVAVTTIAIQDECGFSAVGLS